MPERLFLSEAYSRAGKNWPHIVAALMAGRVASWICLDEGEQEIPPADWSPGIRRFSIWSRRGVGKYRNRPTLGQDPETGVTYVVDNGVEGMIWIDRASFDAALIRLAESIRRRQLEKPAKNDRHHIREVLPNRADLNWAENPVPARAAHFYAERIVASGQFPSPKSAILFLV